MTFTLRKAKNGTIFNGFVCNISSLGMRMGESKKSKLQKKLEMLKRTQEITSFVEQSSIKSIATLGGAEDSQPVEESHALELLEGETPSNMPMTPKRHARKVAIPKSRKPKMRAKAKRKKPR